MLETEIHAIEINSEILIKTIQSLMLAGEAEIAISAAESYRNIPHLEKLLLLKNNGSLAFHNDLTRTNVNRILGEEVFKKPEKRPENMMVTNELVRSSLDSGRSVMKIHVDQRLIEYLFPLYNYPECRDCHGNSEAVRGIIYYRASIRFIFRQIRKSSIVLVVIFLSTFLLIVSLLLITIRLIIIQPLQKISRVIKDIDNGHYDSRLLIKSGDELESLSGNVNHMAKSIEERYYLSKYVSKTTDTLIRERHPYEVVKKNLTILFSDIRGFTSYTESNPPEQVIGDLNLLLDSQARIIDQYGGDVDKYVGDEVMALFDSVENAVNAAEKLHQTVSELNRKINRNFHIGVGINTGKLLAGHIGSDQRKEYAVIGDTVNVAARLCSMAPPDQTYLSEQAYIKVKKQIKAEELKEQKIKGKLKKISIYRILNYHQ